MLFVVLGDVVAHDAHGLAAERAADDGLVLVGGEQRVLVAGDGARLGRRDEAGPDPHAVGAEREGGGETPAVEDAAGRDHGHAVADGVDDLGHERHGRHRPGVAAGLGALGDDEIAAGLDRGDRVAHLAAHVDHDDVVVVAELDDLARHAEGGDEHRHPLRDDVLRRWRASRRGAR